MKDQTNYYVTVGIPIVTFILGYIGSFVTEWLRDKRQSARERESRTYERDRAKEERRDNFQRDTLITLSDLISKFIHVESEIYFHYGRNGIGKLAIDSDLSKRYQDLAAKISTYRVRILDEELRDLVEKMQSNGLKVVFAKNAEELAEFNTVTLSAFANANNKLGFLLRELY